MIQVKLTKKQVSDIEKNVHNGITLNISHSALLKGNRNLVVSKEDLKKAVEALNDDKSAIKIHLTPTHILQNLQRGYLPEITRSNGGFLPALIAALPLLAAGATAAAGTTATAYNLKKIIKGDGLQPPHIGGDIQNLKGNMDDITKQFLMGLSTLSDGQSINWKALIPMFSALSLAGTSLMTKKKASTVQGSGVRRSRSQSRSRSRSRGASLTGLKRGSSLTGLRRGSSLNSLRGSSVTSASRKKTYRKVKGASMISLMRLGAGLDKKKSSNKKKKSAKGIAPPHRIRA